MSRSGYVLKESDLLPLSLGTLLGTGGGRNPYIGMLRARELLRQGASVEKSCCWRRSATTIGSDRSAASARRSYASKRSSKARNVFALCAQSRRPWACAVPR